MDLPKQDLKVNLNNKQNYGEVHSPYSLIEKMFDLIPETSFNDPSKKWLDPGTGRGFFTWYLYHKLMITLVPFFPNESVRQHHILTNMIWMVELNDDHYPTLKRSFPNCNLITEDYLITTTETYQTTFDIIIGNPPFNFGGLKKVPTNHTRTKKTDGKTVWSQFIKKSISLLKDNGLLVFIVPSIWMKEDKAAMYFYMTQFKIHNIHCMSNTEMNMLFKGHAQTPSCYFMLEKKSTDKKTLLYDNTVQDYVEFPLRSENVLPVACARLVREILPFVDSYGSLAHIKKTNLPGKNIQFSETQCDLYPYANIKTCIIKNYDTPELVIQYSNKPCSFYGKKKLVLAHGMYGFPFIDITGHYGISNRDKYVYVSDNVDELTKMKDFLSSDLAFNMFDATRYRMKYLEKYIFRYMPNVLNMSHSELQTMYQELQLYIVKVNKYKTIV